jgi:hypothetical protein
MSRTLFADDAVFPHPCAECAGIETKDSGGSVFPLDSPTGFLEHMEDVVVFQLNEGFDSLAFRLPGLAERIETVQYL